MTVLLSWFKVPLHMLTAILSQYGEHHGPRDRRRAPDDRRALVGHGAHGPDHPLLLDARAHPAADPPGSGRLLRPRPPGAARPGACASGPRLHPAGDRALPGEGPGRRGRRGARTAASDDDVLDHHPAGADDADRAGTTGGPATLRRRPHATRR